jgi:predicted NAD/FAD-binding protein
VRHFAIPLVACVWSAGDEDARSYPARHLFQFLDHHGMLTIGGSPTWRTVTGGSQRYVERIEATLDDVRAGSAVVAVRRHDDGVDVQTQNGAVTTFDRVVLATHADDALALLVDASPEEKTDLAAIQYSANLTWLHRDGSVLPASPNARASWNYRKDACEDDSSGVLVSYWMNRLHGVETADDLVVTLNPEGRVDPTAVIAEMQYRHPIFTPEAVEAARRLRTAGGERLAFAGAHLGWGFHEDGCRSGVEAAQKLGATW